MPLKPMTVFDRHVMISVKKQNNLILNLKGAETYGTYFMSASLGLLVFYPNIIIKLTWNLLHRQALIQKAWNQPEDGFINTILESIQASKLETPTRTCAPLNHGTMDRSLMSVKNLSFHQNNRQTNWQHEREKPLLCQAIKLTAKPFSEAKGTFFTTSTLYIRHKIRCSRA